MNYTELFNIGLPIITLLVGIWVGHAGFKGAVANIETDINEIKSLLHVQVSAPKVV